MSELSQINENLSYIRERVDWIAVNGCAKAATHDATAKEVTDLTGLVNRLRGVLWAVSVFGPVASGVIAWAVMRKQTISATEIVTQVLAKLSTGG